MPLFKIKKPYLYGLKITNNNMESEEYKSYLEKFSDKN